MDGKFGTELLRYQVPVCCPAAAGWVGPARCSAGGGGDTMAILSWEVNWNGDQRQKYPETNPPHFSFRFVWPLFYLSKH
jgi:hypothetical protein